GSGVDAKNVEKLLPFANGVIVGSSLKVKGKLDNPVDEKRVKALKRKLAAWK
ncbi:MAG: putative TIM-barrel enzyme, partial [Limisphaerales bacterium]